MKRLNTDPQPFSAPVLDYLHSVRIPLRLGVKTGSGWPLVVSLWFVPSEGSLYCATQSGARVTSYLRADPRCGFEVAADTPPYCGVRGLAQAEILPDQGIAILRRLLVRYLGDLDRPLAHRLLARGAREVALRLEPIWWSTWNFTDRMAESLPSHLPKPCPPAP